MEEISLSSIVMKKGDGSRCWYPVAKLISNPLSNLSRSGNRSDKLQVSDQGWRTHVVGMHAACAGLC